MTDQTKVPAGADREKFERIAKDLRNRFLPPRRFTDPPLDGLWLAIADAIERAVAEVASRENVCEEARLNGGLMCCSCRTCCEYFMKTTNLERAEINRLKAELAEAKKADADDYTALCTEATSERSKCECKSCEAARAELERVTGELFTWRKRFNAQPSTYQLAAVEQERDTLKAQLEEVCGVLEPFMQLANDTDAPDGYDLFFWENESLTMTNLKLFHCRAARSVLQKVRGR